MRLAELVAHEVLVVIAETNTAAQSAAAWLDDLRRMPRRMSSSELAAIIHEGVTP